MVSQKSCRKGTPKSNEKKLHSLDKALCHPPLNKPHTNTSQNTTCFGFRSSLN